MSEYIGIVAIFILAGVIAGGMVVLASVLGKKSPSQAKSEPFELSLIHISEPTRPY